MQSQIAERNVVLPKRLLERVERRLPRTDMETPDEYVALVLEETLARVEAETDDELPAACEEDIRTRLESLGYVDA